MRILVTRAASQAESLAGPIRELGHEPVILPCIDILTPEDWSEADTALEALSSFDWIVWTSANGVRATFERLALRDISPARPEGVKVAAVGPSTSDELSAFGWTADFMPEEYVSERLGEDMDVRQGERVVLLRGNRATFELPKILRNKGALVTEAVVYRTVDVSVDRLKTELQELDGLPDAITLASPSAARSLFRAAEAAGFLEWILGVRAYCLGPVTADALRKLGKSDMEVPEEHTVRGLLELLERREGHGG